MAQTNRTLLALAALMVAPTISSAQAGMEKSRTVAGGGISIVGWQGKVDAKEATTICFHVVVHQDHLTSESSFTQDT